MSKAKRAGAAVALCLGLALVLSGCSAFDVLHWLQGQTSPDSGAVHATARPDEPDVKIPAGTVVGQGSLTSTDNRISGNLAVLVDGDGNYVFRLSDYRSSVRGLQVQIVLGHVSATARCVRPLATIGLESVTSKPSQDFTLIADPVLTPRNDPSAFRAFVLQDPDAGVTSCADPVSAVAPITWTMPDMDPGLGPVHDSGATGGARGTVTLKKGVPVAYTVVADDLMPEIAARFGVSTDDLDYLNPARAFSRVQTTAYKGETLNLSRADRADGTAG
jgi:hypothetical protein